MAPQKINLTPSPTLRAVTDNASFAVLVLNEDGFNIYANAAAERLPIWCASQVRPCHIADLVDADPSWIQQGLDWLRAEGYWSYRTHLRGSSGESLPVSVNAFTQTTDANDAIQVLLLHARLPGMPDGSLLSDSISRYGLTAGDVRLLMLMSEGLADKQIADALGRSLFSVNRDVARVIQKMGATSRTGACIYAIRSRMIC